MGGDYLHGTANAEGADFTYTTLLNGATATSVTPPTNLDVRISNTRNFFGAYSSLEWRPFERLRFDAGLRINATHESRRDSDAGAGTSASDRRTAARVGASVGALFSAWQRNQDSVSFYINYRDTYKPAAIDFGIEESAGGRLILEPETSRSLEGGIKGRLFDRRVDVEASGFVMNFENLVTAVSIGGLPALINAGRERFQGFESGVAVFPVRDVVARVTYSFHDAHFVDFVQDFDGVPTQLAGKRLEMSARHVAAVGLTYAPARGFIAGVSFNYTGSRFLNKRNTALAEGFGSVDLSGGFRTSRWEIRVDARNVGRPARPRRGK